MEHRGIQPTKSTAVKLGASKYPNSKSKSGIMGQTFEACLCANFCSNELCISLLSSEREAHASRDTYFPLFSIVTYKHNFREVKIGV